MIVVTPGTRAARIPVDDPIAATDGVLLDHAPPVVPSAITDEVPVQAVALPVIDTGDAVTVIVFITVHPEPKE